MQNFNKNYCTLIYEDGYHHVITPMGSKIPGVLTTITTDTVGLNPQCTLTIHCNIAKDLEDAINNYQNEII